VPNCASVTLSFAAAAAAAVVHCRMVEQPTRVGPYLVPPGVIVFPNLYAIMNYSGNWQQPEQVRLSWILPVLLSVFLAPLLC
jgi:hypothetical protein